MTLTTESRLLPVDYSHKISRYETQLEVWKDNNTKENTFVLQNYPEELQVELKNQESWAEIDDARSVLRLLVLIQDL